MVPGGSIRESCLHALADLSGLSATRTQTQWQQWWKPNREFYQPKQMVDLQP